MIDPLSRYARTSADRRALWTPDRTYSYTELSAGVGRTVRRLAEVGVAKGARIAVHRPRDARTILLFWALWRLGAVVVPISRRLPPSEVLDRVHRVGCDVLITDDSTVEDAATEMRTVRGTDLVSTKKEQPIEEAGVPEAFSDRQPATIVYTSGSTGTPKAVLHSWGNHRYSAKGSNANLPLRSGDRWMLSLPLYHVGGIAILVRCALAGASIAIPPPSQSIARGLRATKATHVSVVATQLRRLLDDSDAGEFDDLRAILVGGGPIPDALLRQATARAWPIATSYGSTELASQVTTTCPGASYADLQTAGRCLLHRRIRIEEGEIHVNGATLCEGYVSANGLSDVRTEEGWFATGDRGTLDAEGRLRVLGRMDRMFVSGGENIQPEEIESKLERLEGVKRAAVVPVPDDEFGARPIAFVEWIDGGESKRLESALRRTLPGFKIPDAFHSLPSEATSGSLKMDYELLRRRAQVLRVRDTHRE